MATGTVHPTAVPPPLPAEVEHARVIHKQLGRTSLHVRLVDLAASLALWGIGVLVFLLAAALVDHWLGGLGTAGRAMALVLLVAGSVWFLLTRIGPLLVRGINPSYAARTIEEATPSLKNSLINFLMLRQDRSGVREVVYHAVEAKAAADIAAVPVEATVDRSKLIRAGYVLCGVMAVFAAYKILSPKDPFQTVARVAMPWANIARPSRVEITDVLPGTTEVYHGQVVEVSAAVKGVREGDPVTLRFSTADGQTVDRAVAMTADSAGVRYQCTLPPPEDNPLILSASGIQQATTYRIVAGDAETPPYTLKVVSAPTIIVERLEYQYPAYTKKAPETVPQQGDIKALEGTRVTVHASSNQPIQKAWIEFDPGAKDASPEVLQLASDGTRAWGTMILQLKTDRQTPWHAAYQVRFINDRDQLSQQPILHKLDVIRDLPPEVQILQPQRVRIEVPENGEQTLEVRGVDPDYGLARLRIEGTVAGKLAVDLSLLDPKLVHPPQATQELLFRPAEHKLKAGDELRYVAVAEDNRTHPITGQPEPNVARSQEYTLVVVAPTNAESNPQPNPDARPMPGEEPPMEGDMPPQPPKAGEKPPMPMPPRADQPRNPDQKNPQQNQEQPGEQKNKQPMMGESGGQAQQNPGEQGSPDSKQGEQGQPGQKGGESGEKQSGEPMAGENPKAGDKPMPGENPMPGQNPQAGEQPMQGDPQQGEKQPGQQQKGEPMPGGQPEGSQGESGESGEQQGEGAQSGGKSSANQSGQPQQSQPMPGADPMGGEAGQAGGQPAGNSPQPAGTEGDPTGADTSGQPSGSGQTKRQGKAHEGELIEQVLKDAQQEQRQPGEPGQGGTKQPNSQQQPADGEPGAGEQNAGENSAGQQPAGQQNPGAKNAGQQPMPGERGQGQPMPGEQAPGQNEQGAQPEPGSQPNEAGQDTPQAGESGTKNEGAQAGQNPGEGSEQPPMPGGPPMPGAAKTEAGEKANPNDRVPGEERGENPSEQKSQGQKGGSPQGANKTDPGEKSKAAEGEKKDPGAGQTGDEGAGENSSDKTGSGQGQEANRDRNKEMKPDGQGKQEGEPSPPSGSKKQSDSKGGQSGDKSGGGKKGAGQSAGQEGNDSPGSKSAADDGAGAAEETGSGETGSKAGSQKDASGKTGQSGSKAGEGSKSRSDAEGNKSGSKPGEPAGKSEQKAGEDGGKRPGQGGGAGPVVGGGGDVDRAKVDYGPQPEVEAADAANLEYARKATDLVLKKLKDQEHNPDPELLDKLGWSQEDLAEFLRRWEALQKSADKSPEGKRELDEALRSLGLRSPANRKRAGGDTSDTQRDLRDGGNRSAPPPGYRDLFDAFRKGAARGGE